VGVTLGIIWNVLIATILFRSYRFFELVVVCVLVMIFSAVATMRADLEPGSLLHSRESVKDSDATALCKESDLLQVCRLPAFN
jgi:hypothetical protein